MKRVELGRGWARGLGSQRGDSQPGSSLSRHPDAGGLGEGEKGRDRVCTGLGTQRASLPSLTSFSFPSHFPFLLPSSWPPPPRMSLSPTLVCLADAEPFTLHFHLGLVLGQVPDSKATAAVEAVDNPGGARTCTKQLPQVLCASPHSGGLEEHTGPPAGGCCRPGEGEGKGQDGSECRGRGRSRERDKTCFVL